MQMKNTIFLLGLIFVIIGCEKKEAPGPLTIDPPKEITLIKGDNQKGYPGFMLPDSIVIKVTLNKLEDLKSYSYYFKTDYGNWTQTRSYVINNVLYITAFWRLNSQKEMQESKFYLTEKCEVNYYPSNCRKIDSLTIRASTKRPWVETFSGAGGILYDMHFSDDKNGIVIGNLAFSTGYLQTGDGGQTWNFTNNYRKDLYQLSFSDPDTGLVIVTNNWAYFTNDGGKSFHEEEWSPSIIGHRSSSDYFMLNRKTIYSVGVKGTITKSVNGGKTWEKYQGFTFINGLYSITCPVNEVCYACGEVGKVVKTSDSGKNWIEQKVMLNNYLKRIYFLNSNFGFAGGQYGALIRTTDGGENWEIISSGLRYPIIEIYFSSKDVGYIVSSSGEIGKTEDGGITWFLINKENYGVNDLNKVFIKEHVLWGLQGGSIYKYDLSNE